MATAALRILCRLEFPGSTIRLWDGAGPYMDADGNIWLGASLPEGLDQIESAMNGEASTLSLRLMATDPRIAAKAFDDLEADLVIGSTVVLLIQSCDALDQPVGSPEVRYTGTIDNMVIEDAADEDGVSSVVTVDVVNRFTLRTMTSGSVLSDTDQRARSAVLNPGAPADRFCDRVSGLADREIRWPGWS